MNVNNNEIQEVERSGTKGGSTHLKREQKGKINVVGWGGSE
jgi:hypothetical protein